MPDSFEDLLDFTPVPMTRTRSDGWTPRAQRMFVYALVKLGGVAAAAKACSMTAKSAYRLRARAGSDAFAEAWDIALRMGRDDAFERAIERGVNGCTVPVYRAGKLTGVKHSFDNRLLYAAIRRGDDAPSALRQTTHREDAHTTYARAIANLRADGERP